jgi:AcrR family transcriptional regulator
MSSRREKTRATILEAAWKRLSIPGDPARLEDIAADAGVTRQSVYLHFGTRAGLLVAVVQHMDEVLGLMARIAEIRAVEDPVEAFEKNLRLMASYQTRIHGVAMALTRLKETDPDARAAFDDRMKARHDGLLALLRVLSRAGLLAQDWTLGKVADVIWEAGAPSSYEHLVVERGWTPKDFERWLVHLGRSFLTPEARQPH